jgi:hypothetical protein
MMALPAPVTDALQALPWSSYIRESSWGFPIVESAHVLAVVVLVGTIAVVDLRLIGLASSNCAVTEVSRDTLKWTWGAFIVAVVTGLGMLIPKLEDYLATPSLWLKFAFIVLAAANMAVFEFLTVRSVAQWDRGPPPLAAKVAGLVSLACWIVVVIFGRWIGYTVSGGMVFGGGF